MTGAAKYCRSAEFSQWPHPAANNDGDAGCRFQIPFFCKKYS